jgi:hypothetical protein
MTRAQKSPRTWGQADAGGYDQRPECSRSLPQLQRRFPLCRLHSIPLVDDLPPGCPLRASSSLRAVQDYQDRGYRRLADHDHAGGLDDLARAEICSGCVARLIGHAHVRRLRHAVGVGDAA